MRRVVALLTLVLSVLFLGMIGASGALAQDTGEVDCYVNPEDPACEDSEVRGERTERPSEPATEGSSTEGPEVLGERAERTEEGALAQTGVNTTLLVLIAGALAGAGTLAVVAARKRTSSTS